MKKGLCTIALALLLLPTLGGCPEGKVEPTLIDGAPGFVVIVSEKDKAKYDEELSKFDKGVEKVADALPVVVNLAKLAAELSKNEDFSEGANDVAEAAEKGVAALGLAAAISCLLRGLVKKEDS